MSNFFSANPLARAATYAPSQRPTSSSRVNSPFGISRKTFEDLEDYISSLQRGTREFDKVMDVAAHLLAKTQQGFAQRYYRGPQSNPTDVRLGRGAGRAGTIPVRRITGQTMRGWKVKRIAPGVWETFNEERGAYMVEHGIVRGGGGVRRPVLKMSAIATLKFIQRTRFGNRIMADTFGNLRNNKGQFSSFAARMQGSSLLGITGPSGYLPG